MISDARAVKRPLLRLPSAGDLAGIRGRRGDGNDSAGGTIEEVGLRGESPAERLVNLVRDSDAEVFFDVTDHSQAYVTLSIKGRRETLRLRSRRCRDMLKGIHYQRTGTVIGDGLLRAAIDTLSGLAGLEESTGRLSVRVAGDLGRILYDLAGEDGRAIEVTAAGWRVVDRPTVRFWRPEGIRPLPAPIPGGAVRPAARPG